MVDVQILKDARALIARPGGWTQGRDAADSCGYSVFARSDAAICFCAVGALVRANKNVAVWPLVEAVALAAGIQSGSGWLVNWNDEPDRTQAQVVAAFDKAIAAAEARAVA